MISDTDVQCAFNDFAGVDDVAVAMVPGPSVLKSIHLLPTDNETSFVQLYDVALYLPCPNTLVLIPLVL